MSAALHLSENERADVLWALRLWVRNYGHEMQGSSKQDLEVLIEKIDIAGSRITCKLCEKVFYLDD